MTAPSAERQAFENVIRDLTNRGYQVVQEPSPEVLPEFLGNFRPDLVAFKEGGPNLVVEVKRRGFPGANRLSDVRRRFEGHPDWQFSVVWVDPLESRTIQTSSAQAILARADEAVELVRAGFLGPALLICWALLESVARGYEPIQLSRPQAPKSVVQFLESQGLIDIQEAHQLRALAEARNRLIHGWIEESISEKDLKDFLTIVQRLIRGLTSARNSTQIY